MSDLEPAEERPLGLSMGSWLRIALLAIVGVGIVAVVRREKPAPLPTAATAQSSWAGEMRFAVKCDGHTIAERVLVVAVRSGGKPVETAGRRR